MFKIALAIGGTTTIRIDEIKYQNNAFDIMRSSFNHLVSGKNRNRFAGRSYLDNVGTERIRKDIGLCNWSI